MFNCATATIHPNARKVVCTPEGDLCRVMEGPDVSYTSGLQPHALAFSWVPVSPLEAQLAARLTGQRGLKSKKAANKLCDPEQVPSP